MTSGLDPSPCSLRGVSKRYGSTTAVAELDLDVQPAEVLALLGPNGAGKTTTVEMCEGFIKPDSRQHRDPRARPGRRQRRGA